MKSVGMDVIRIAESTWSILEPVEDEFHFEYIKEAIEYASKIGLSIIIGTPTYAVPSWLVRKDSDVLVTRKDG